MTKYLFDVKLFAEIWVEADSDEEAREHIRAYTRVLAIDGLHGKPPHITGIEQEAILNESIKLADDQPEQEEAA